MEVTSELLAAYVENRVTEEERIEIRKYLTEHPEEIESLLLMIDEDSEIMMDDESAPGKSALPSFTGAGSGVCQEIIPSLSDASPLLPRVMSIEAASRRIAVRIDELMEEMG